MPIEPHPAPVFTKPPSTVPARSVGGSAEQRTAERHAHSADLVYALGTLGFEIESSTRAASLGQLTPDGTIDSMAELQQLLAANPHLADALYWTLDVDGHPLYAIAPAGAHAALVYQRLVRLLIEQTEQRIERVSLAGRLTGRRRLPSGAEVSVVRPELRGLFGWSTRQLVDDLFKRQEGTPEQAAHTRDSLWSILESLYREHQHAGREEWQRALHYAATNPFMIEQAVREAAGRGLDYVGIRVDLPAGGEGAAGIARVDDGRRIVRLTLTFADAERQDVLLRYLDIDVGDAVPALVIRRDSGDGRRPPLTCHLLPARDTGGYAPMGAAGEAP